MIKHTTRFFAVTAVLAGGLLLGDPAQAQEGRQAPRQGQEQHEGRRGGPGRGNPEQRLALLAERLQLTTDQQARIRRIFEQQRAETERLRPARGEGQRGQRGQGQARPRGERRQGPPAEFRQLRERTDQQIEAVLNDRQKTEYRRLREERQQRGRDGQQKRGGEQRGGEDRQRAQQRTR